MGRSRFCWNGFNGRFSASTSAPWGYWSSLAASQSFNGRFSASTSAPLVTWGGAGFVGMVSMAASRPARLHRGVTGLRWPLVRVSMAASRPARLHRWSHGAEQVLLEWFQWPLLGQHVCTVGLLVFAGR